MDDLVENIMTLFTPWLLVSMIQGLRAYMEGNKDCHAIIGHRQLNGGLQPVTMVALKNSYI